MRNYLRLNSVGKSFQRSWLFRNIELEFPLNPGDSYAFLGNNGAGKSSLLLLLCGQITPTEGHIEWVLDHKKIPDTLRHQHHALTSPAMELLEELTLREWYSFLDKVKPFSKNTSLATIAELCGFTNKTLDKPIAYYSSGMKQRVKLCSSLLCDVPVVFLDEPTANLDTQGIALYHQLTQEALKNKAIFLASNDAKEYEFIQNRYLIDRSSINQV